MPVAKGEVMEYQGSKAEQISMEDFIESATRAVLRALQSGLNPQPLPPRETPGEDAAPLNPQPLPPFDITVGLILSSGGDEVAAPRSSKI